MTYCDYASSLGDLEGTPEQVWGTPPYDWKRHRKETCVFFGCYDLRTYLKIWRHKGKAYVLWAGSDLLNLRDGFLFNDGKLKTFSLWFKGLFHRWVSKTLMKAEHWVETEAEAQTLRGYGILSFHVAPSYMGDVKALKPRYRHRSRMKVYCCSPEGRQEEYGFGVIEKIAGRLPKVRFHLYGAAWETERRNVIVHGRVPKGQMNEEIADMQVALRLNRHDGFSEITAKGILMGQHVITRIPHPHLRHFATPQELSGLLDRLRRKGQAGPDPGIRAAYMRLINSYPWNRLCETS